MSASSSSSSSSPSLFLKDAVAALSTAYSVSPTVILYLLYGFNGDLSLVDAYLSGNSTSAPWSFYEDRLLRVKIRHADSDNVLILATRRTPEEISDRVKFLSIKI